MAEKKSAEDRVADLDKKIKQMQAQKRAILQREKEAARKARTKRLTSDIFRNFSKSNTALFRHSIGCRIIIIIIIRQPIL